MIKNSILFKIFIRYLKEKGVFNLYKSKVTDSYFTKLDYNYKTYTNSAFTYLSFFIFTNCYDTEIYKFLTHYKNVNEFRIILNLYLKKYCISFLEEKGLSKLLVNNIMHYHFSYIHIRIAHNVNLNKKSNVDKIINRIIDYFITENISLIELLSNTFDTFATDEGHNFWYNKYHEFIEYINNKLLIL